MVKLNKAEIVKAVKKTTDQITNNTTDKLITVDPDKLKGFSRLNLDTAKKQIFNSLEQADSFEKRRVSALQICSQSLANVWQVQSATSQNNGRVADTKTLVGILRGIVDEQITETDEASKQRKKSLLSSATDISKQAQLILAGICFVGITSKENTKFLEPQPMDKKTGKLKLNKDIHNIRVFNMENDPFPFLDRGADQNPSRIDEDAKVCTTKAMTKALYDRHFLGNQLNAEKTAFKVSDQGKATAVDFPEFQKAIKNIKAFIGSNIFDGTAKDIDEKLKAHIYTADTVERHNNSDFSENYYSKEVETFTSLNVWLNETMQSFKMNEKIYRESQEEEASLPEEEKAS